MKNKVLKRFLPLLFALILVFASTLSAFAEPNPNGDIIVLYTNDVHCAIDDYAVLAAYRAELISQGYEVITVDAGDAIQGEMIGTLTEGEAVVDIMNSAGYDFAALGNHEFDYTVETLIKLAEVAEYEYICANFKDLRTNESLFKPYVIKEIGDEKIAFVGISTPETYSKSTPAYFQNEEGEFIYSFMEDSFYETIQSAVDSAIAEGATTVIAVCHLGIEAVTEGWRSTDVIANTDGIDAVFDAHSHETIPSAVYKNSVDEDVALSSTGTKLKYFGKLTLNSQGEITTELVTVDSVDITAFSQEAQDAYNEVKEKIDTYNAEFEYLFEELGESEILLTTNDADGDRAVRNKETNMGDFVTDAYKAVTGADIAFANGGGVRSEIGKGAVTRKAIMDVNPWSNEMCVLKVTGQQILDALEYGVSVMPTEFGSFPQVSGITFEVHTYIETPVITDELGDFVSITPNAPRRVANVLVNGEAIDEDAEYTLAGSCYMLQLSGYKMFGGAEVVASPDELLTDSETLLEYFTNHLNGKITAEQYGKIEGDGRITVVAENPNEEIPVPGDSSSVALLLVICVASLYSAIYLSKRKN